MKTVSVQKADRLWADDYISDTCIRIEGEFHADKLVPGELVATFARDADELADVLRNTLPGGTLDRLVARLLMLKASTLVVPAAIPEPERLTLDSPAFRQMVDEVAAKLQADRNRGREPVGNTTDATFYVASSRDGLDDVDQITQFLERRGWHNAFAWPDHFGHTCSIENCGIVDRADLAMVELKAAGECDLFIGVSRMGKGTHVELGAALTGTGKRIILVGADVNDSCFYEGAEVEHVPNIGTLFHLLTDRPPATVAQRSRIAADLANHAAGTGRPWSKAVDAPPSPVAKLSDDGPAK